MKKGGRIVLVVVLANTLALGMFVKDWAARKNIGEIQRNTYGKGSRTESYRGYDGRPADEGTVYRGSGGAEV